MERYASLAPYGQHRGPVRADAAATSTEVRGMPAEDSRPAARVEHKDSSDQSSPLAHHRYRLARSGGQYLLTTLRDGHTLEDSFEDVGEYTSVSDATTALPSDLHFYVFENSQTGAVEMRQARDLAHGLTLTDGFDQVRVFAAQDEAEAYAKRKSS